MSPLSRLKHRTTSWLVLLVVLVFCADAPALLDSTFVPSHDTFLHTLHFHHSYWHLREHGDWPRWSPHVNYGVPTLASMQFAFTPSDYAAMAVGAALHTADVLLLQKWAIFVDRVLFACGMYLLALSLLRSKTATLMVAVLAALMPLWHANAPHAFRIYSLLPFSLLSLRLFATTLKPEYFWVAGLITVVSLIGNAIYAAPLHALVLACFFIPIMPSPRDVKRALLARTWANGAAATAFLLAAAVLVAVIHYAYAGVAVVSPGRSAEGGITLESYLADVAIGVPALVYIWTHGWPILTELSLYAGLLSWWATAWALVRVRERAFAAASLPLLVLFAIGLTDAGATTAFYGAPLMCYFRPIRYVVGTACAVFLPLTAGFGIASLLAQPLRTRLTWQLAALVGGAVLGLIAEASCMNQALATFQADHRWHLALDDMTVLSIRLVVYAMATVPLVRECMAGDGSPHRAVWARMLIYSLLFDLAIYRFNAYGDPARPHAVDASRFKTAWSLRYLPQRDCTARFTSLPSPPSAFYDQQYVFEGIDPCLPAARSQIMTRGVASLLSQRLLPPALMSTCLAEEGGWYCSTLSQRDARMRVPASPSLDDPVLQRVLACSAPKLQFHSQVRRATSWEEAWALTARPARIDELPVVMSDEQAPPMSNDAAACSAAVVGFSANEIVVDVSNDGSGHVVVVYADAFHPEWFASVDGVPQRTAVVNLGFKGVSVPPGKHRVCWRFGGPGRRMMHWGMSVGSVCGLAAGLAVVSAAMRQRVIS